MVNNNSRPNKTRNYIAFKGTQQITWFN